MLIEQAVDRECNSCGGSSANKVCKTQQTVDETFSRQEDWTCREEQGTHPISPVHVDNGSCSDHLEEIDADLQYRTGLGIGKDEEDSALKISTTISFAMVGSEFDASFLDADSSRSGRVPSGTICSSCVVSTSSKWPGLLVEILFFEGASRRFLRLTRLVALRFMWPCFTTGIFVFKLLLIAKLERRNNTKMEATRSIAVPESW